MIKYIEATNIYATWMIRKQTLSISNKSLNIINTKLVEILKEKNDYHIFNLGEYDKDFFIKCELGLICKDNVNTLSLMNKLSFMDMDTYLDICNSIEELNHKKSDLTI